GGNDIFIAKFDRSGEALWAMRAGGPKNFDEGFGITTDYFGNIIVTGRFNGSVTFGSVSLDSGEKVGFFLAKYDPDGELLWAVQGAGEGYGVAASLQGAIYLAGGIPGGIFVYRYDSNGNLIWQQYGQSAGTAYATAITLDPSGGILMTGRFTGNLGFEKMGLAGSIDYNMFLLKYHESGELLWAQKADYANGAGVGCDGQNNVYVTGWFQGQTPFGDIVLNSKRPNMFIAKYDHSGNVVWAKPMRATDDTYGRGIATDINGNSFVAGEFVGTLIFDGAKLHGPGMFIVKYDASGNALWAQKVRGTSNVMGLGVAVDSTGNPAVTGSFYQNVDFGFINMKTAGGTDGFVAYISKDGCSPLPSAHAFGRIIDGDHSHVEEVCYTFAGQTGDLNLLYQVYDIDMPAEVKVFLNGVHIHNEKTTNDSSWSDTRVLLLEDALVHDSGLNEIRFVNAENVKHSVKRYWGVRAVSVARCIPLPFAAEVGYLVRKGR
ncbi:MAG: SBBP repeat-containing protein, partial [bacterium]